MNIYRFYKNIYKDNKYRIQGRRKLFKDILLYYKNLLYKTFFEKDLIIKHYSEKFPIVFIVGAPRSGTTLISQIISRYFKVAYVTNSIAPYFMAPVFGASKNAEINRSLIGFDSFLGNTDGDFSPHEFGYFWEYWLNHRHHDNYSGTNIRELKWKNIRDELCSLAGYYQLPLVIKSLVYTDYYILDIIKHFRNVKIVYVSRNPKYIVQSIYKSRISKYGDVKFWWSIRPKEYRDYLQNDPIEQICYQVYDVKSSIENDLGSISSDKYIEISYEDVVGSPISQLKKISGFLNLNYNKIEDLNGSIINGNIERLPKDILLDIEKEVKKYKF